MDQLARCFRKHPQSSRSTGHFESARLRHERRRGMLKRAPHVANTHLDARLGFVSRAKQIIGIPQGLLRDRFEREVVGARAEHADDEHHDQHAARNQGENAWDAEAIEREPDHK